MEIPHDLDAERQILGALLVRPDIFVQVHSIVTPQDLFKQSHRIIYDALSDVYHEGGLDSDPIQLIQYLRDRSLLEQAGGDRYILRLAEDVLSPSGSLAHARRVKNLALRRSLMETAQEILEDASKPVEDENQFLKSVEDRILGITNRSFAHGVKSIRELKDDFADYIEKLVSARGSHTGIITHFREFDDLTGGLKGGELIVLAARPGMGKTTFAMNIAANVIQKEKKNVLLFSLEMSRMELLLRLVCSTAQYPLSDLKRGNISGGRVQDVLNTIEQLFTSPLFIDDTGNLDIFDLVVRSRKLAVDLDQKGESVGLIIVDYLQLLTDPESRKFGRQNEVAAISRSLKQLSKIINVPVLALSQMNRSVEQRRGDSRPQLSDLRESGAIEQDADIVMFIHKESADEENSENIDKSLALRGNSEIIIAKHRNGPVGSFFVAFRPEINRFDNVAQSETSDHSF